MTNPLITRVRSLLLIAAAAATSATGLVGCAHNAAGHPMRFDKPVDVAPSASIPQALELAKPTQSAGRATR